MNVKTQNLPSCYLHVTKLYLYRIRDNRSDVTGFEYDADWIQSGFSISPFYLPLKPGLIMAKRDPFAGNFGVFDDSLPDGWGNQKLFVPMD